MSGESNHIIAELDRVRDEAQAAFMHHDAEGYMRMFSPDVEYKQSSGSVVNYERLETDVRRQLSLMALIEISRTRHAFEVLPDKAVEIVTQHTSITATAFFLITRTMRLTRKGKYIWQRMGERWQITQAEILSEAVTSQWALGFVKPRRIIG